MAWFITNGQVAHAQPKSTAPVVTSAPASTSTTTSAAEKTSCESNWALRVGVGRSAVEMRRYYSYSDTTSGGELHVDLAYRVNEAVAIGAHAGVTLGTTQLEESYAMGSQSFVDRSMRPIEIGASLQLFPLDRLWAAPWVGMVHIGGQIEQNRLAVGASLGVDLAILPSGHRFGVYARGLQTSGFSNEDGIQAFMFGGSYGYR